jgi:hypothetical protein
MKIRTALVRGLAAILAVTGFAGAAFATDNFGNCTAVGAGELDCSANHYGDLLINHWGDQSIFNLFEFSKDQTATLKNTGNVEYDVLIEQGASTVYQGTVSPGASINIAPLDNGYFSWTEYSVIISNPDGKPYLTPNAKARIHVIAFTPVHNQCNDRCTKTGMDATKVARSIRTSPRFARRAATSPTTPV